MNLKLKTKRAAEDRIGAVSFADRLITDETIDSSAVTEIGTTDLTITDLEPEDEFVRYLVSGGVAGQEYQLQVQAVTSESQTLIKVQTLKVI